MKLINYKRTITTALATLASTVQLFAKDTPKTIPTPRGSGGFDDGTVVGGTIDNFIPLLFLGSIVLGAYILNKRQKADSIL